MDTDGLTLPERLRRLEVRLTRLTEVVGKTVQLLTELSAPRPEPTA